MILFSALIFVSPICFDISLCPTDFKVGCGSFAAGTKDVQHSSESADDAEDGSLAFQKAVSDRCGQYYCPRCCTKCNHFAHVDILCPEHTRFVLQHQFRIILGDSLVRTNWLYKTSAVFFFIGLKPRPPVFYASFLSPYDCVWLCWALGSWYGKNMWRHRWARSKTPVIILSRSLVIRTSGVRKTQLGVRPRKLFIG